MIMRPNSGKLIKAASTIVWDVHYHAVGEEITDTVELGLSPLPELARSRSTGRFSRRSAPSRGAATICRLRRTR